MADAVPITDDGGVSKIVTVVSPHTHEKVPGAALRAGDLVQINYVGTVEDPIVGGVVEFDRNVGGYPFEFKLGSGAVIRGWDIAVASMRVGESAQLIIQALYGYGDEGSEADIPPGATLYFDVEVAGVKNRSIFGGEDGEETEEERLVRMKAERAAAAEEKAGEKQKREEAKEAAKAGKKKGKKKGGKGGVLSAAAEGAGAAEGGEGGAEGGGGGIDKVSIKKMKPTELKAELKSRGLAITGNKKDLQGRLLEAIA